MTNPLSLHDVDRLNTLTSVASNDYLIIEDVSTGQLVKSTVANVVAGDAGVVGPASATDNAIARFDGTTGKLIQNSAATIDDTTGAITIAGTSNQIVLGTTRTLTLTAPTPASASRTVTLPDPGGSDSVAYLALSQALTNKTINGNTITSGTGTLTLGAGSTLATSATNNITLTSTGATNVTLPTTGTMATLAGAETLTNKTITGAINTDTVRCSAQKDSTTATLANITGLTCTVVPGTYKFRAVLPGLADGTGGVKYAFKLTTTVLTSIDATGIGNTSSAVATQHTTTTADQTLLFDQAAAVILTIIEGSTVVGTGGTIDLQTAQHTNSGTSSTYVGATLQFTRIA